MKKILISAYLFFVTFAIFAQGNNHYDVLRHRLNQINKYHIGLELECAINTNIVCGFKTFIGYGNYRHLLNADIGVGIRFWNYPINVIDRYKMFQIPVSASLDVNPIRWSKGCLFLGGETSINFGVWNSASNNIGNVEYNDRKALKNYVSIKGKIGIIQRKIKIAFFYEQDLSSFCNQKYIYESGLYDFDRLHNSIYEHNRIGMTLSYSFNLK